MSLLSEALKGMPVLAVMWYMLRDLRTLVKEITLKIPALETKVDHNVVRVEVINEKLKEAKDEASKLRDTVLTLEKQMPAIWAKIGSRASDKHPRRDAE